MNTRLLFLFFALFPTSLRPEPVADCVRFEGRYGSCAPPALIVGDIVNVRASDSLKSPVIDVLHFGDIVLLTGFSHIFETVPGVGQSEWNHVNAHSKRGSVFGAYITENFCVSPSNDFFAWDGGAIIKTLQKPQSNPSLIHIKDTRIRFSPDCKYAASISDPGSRHFPVLSLYALRTSNKIFESLFHDDSLRWTDSGAIIRTPCLDSDPWCWVETAVSGDGKSRHTGSQGILRHLIDKENGLLLESDSALVWQKCLYGQTGTKCTGMPLSVNWNAAFQYCANLPPVPPKYAKWRLPTQAELVSAGQNQNAYTSFSFYPAEITRLWTSTVDKANPSRIAVTDLGRANSFKNKTEDSYLFARCVAGPE